jgi:hypothetical protein
MYNRMKKFFLFALTLLIVSSLLSPFFEGTPQNVYAYSSTGDFSLVVLPDTQYYSSSYPSIYTAQTQWVSDNKDNLNVAFVTHEGDIIDINLGTSQWNNANRAMSILDNTGVPYGVLPGNHDILFGSTNYNAYFGYSRYSGKPWYGGAYQNVNMNNFELFSGGSDDYLIFHLQNQPSTQVLAWANSTIAAYPTRRVIVTTHDYMNTDGSRTTAGNNIWNKFVKPHGDQVFLVLCGHNFAENRRVDLAKGHLVYQLLADYQTRSNGGNGWLRLLKFHPLSDEIVVETYSPYLGQYETDADSSFTLSYDMGEPAIPPSQLTATVKTDKLAYSRKQTATITVNVKDGVNPVTSVLVSVKITDPSGKSSIYGSITTDSNGNAFIKYTISSKALRGTYTVEVTADKTGYYSATATTIFTVN